MQSLGVDLVEPMAKVLHIRIAPFRVLLEPLEASPDGTLDQFEWIAELSGTSELACEVVEAWVVKGDTEVIVVADILWDGL